MCFAGGDKCAEETRESLELMWGCFGVARGSGVWFFLPPMYTYRLLGTLWYACLVYMCRWPRVMDVVEMTSCIVLTANIVDRYLLVGRYVASRVC